MIISYNWLKKYIKTPLELNQLAQLLTDIGLEVESIKKNTEEFSYLFEVISAEVLSIEKHPNADFLRIAQISIGENSPLEIISGASNIAKGQKVLLAKEGARLPGEKGSFFEIKKTKIRGVLSHGMLCSEAELKLGKDNQGILVLESSTPIGISAFELFYKQEDFAIEIGLTPNRSDAMSHYGVARDLYAAIKARQLSQAELILPSTKLYEKEKSDRFLDLEIQIESKKCICYNAAALFNVKVGLSPTWLVQALRNISIEPINNVVDLTNFLMYETGQPLHAYDLDKISEKKISIKSLENKGNQKNIFQTLMGKEKIISNEDLLICDENSILGLAGIIGGENSSIKKKTTNILIESAIFDPIAIRKSAKAHELNTEASFRFERGVNPNNSKYVLKRALLLLKELTGGEISSNLIEVYPKIKEKTKICLRYKKIFQILGALDKEKIKEILELLEIKIISTSKEALEVEVPTYRIDVEREIDVIEEIARIYGYNELPSKAKIQFSTQIETKEAKNQEKIYKNITNQLVGHGFYESMNLSFTKQTYHQIAKNPSELISMLNPISNDLFFLRDTLLFGLLELLHHNINRKKQKLKFFEKGKTYFKKEDQNKENNYKEKEFLSLISSQKEETKSNPFFYLKGIVEQLLIFLNLENVKQKDSTFCFFSEGLDFFHKETKILKIGEIKKEILKFFSIDQKVFYVEIDWENLLQVISLEKRKFEPLIKYPIVKRDLALVVDEKVSFEEIYQLAKSSKEEILKKIELFDIYQGQQLDAGKKSYALSFFLQDKERTLSETQIENTMKHIENKLKEELGARLR